MTLLRSAKPQDDEIEGLRSRLRDLNAELRERDTEIARAKSDLEAFRIKYRQRVGSLHEQLDELHDAISEAELAAPGERRESEAGDAAPASDVPRPEPPPRFTSDAVRKLFRDVAKTIHPDLAADEIARERRHALMVEANRAYAMGDEERLRWILGAWETSPESVQGSDRAAMRQRLVLRIAQIEEQLGANATELAAMKDAPLWTLKVMVDQAAGRNKDLIGDMVTRLKRDILVARNRLDAIQWTP